MLFVCGKKVRGICSACYLNRGRAPGFPWCHKALWPTDQPALPADLTVPRLARRHAQRAIQSNDLAVEIAVAYHMQDELGEFAGLTKALGKRH